MRKIFLSVLTVLIFATSIAYADPLLGPAQDYNMFLFGDVNVYTSDSHGRIAAGGNVSLTNYNVGGSPASDYSVIAGGDFSYLYGTVWNGGVFAGGNVSVDHYTINGDLTANGGITYLKDGVVVSYIESGTVTGTRTPYAGADIPIDFGQAYIDLRSTSTALAGMTATAIAEVQYETNLHFWGSGADVDIFNLNLTQEVFDKITNFTFHDIGDNVAIINVSGFDEFNRNLGMNGLGDPWVDGKDENILWNFFEADTLDLRGTVRGSILAPDADVTFNNGNLWGNLVANSMTGDEEFHAPPFNPDVVIIPEPVSSILFLVGAATLGFRRFGKRISL